LDFLRVSDPLHGFDFGIFEEGEGEDEGDKAMLDGRLGMVKASAGGR